MKTTTLKHLESKRPTTSAMNRLLLATVFAALTASHLMAATFPPTTINSTTWTKAGNPYIIPTICTVPSGQVLTIEPGVEVILAPGAELNVQGRIIAGGSKSEHITFRGVSASNYWNRVFIQGLGNGPSQLNYCDFSDASSALFLYSNTETMETEILNCTFLNCTDSAIHAEAAGFARQYSSGSPTVSPTIKNCLIQDCASNGIEFAISGQNYQGRVSSGSANPIVQNNVLYNLGGFAFVFNHSGVYPGASQPIVVNNSVSSADKGLWVRDPYDIVVKNNIIANCTTGIERFNASTLNQIIHYNCLFNNGADFVNYPAVYGLVIWTNANGDPADINFNIFADPLFGDTNTLALAVGSPCIDRGIPPAPSWPVQEIPACSTEQLT